MSNVIAKKTVNALIKDAEVNFTASYVITPGVEIPIDSLFPAMKKAMGGLWVGGNATLTEDTLAFAPNKLNMELHKGDVSVEIPLAEVTGVRVKGGILTKIIDVETSHGKLSIRCFGAKDFAAAIEQQAKKTSAG